MGAGGRICSHILGGCGMEGCGGGRKECLTRVVGKFGGGCRIVGGGEAEGYDAPWRYRMGGRGEVADGGRSGNVGDRGGSVVAKRGL